MLYEELSDLTKNQCTFEQYEVIEKIYNDCVSMTKLEAAAVWRQTYGKEMKRRERVRGEFEERLISTRDLPLSERGEDIQQAIHQAEKALREKNRRWEEMRYIDPKEVHWAVLKWGTTSNGCYTIWSLGFIRNREFEGVRYNFF